MPKMLDIPVMKMLESWEMGYDNMVTDEDGRILNLIKPSEWMFKRLRRLYEFEGAVYLAPAESKIPTACDDHNR